jgi:diaminopimelate epimerase
MKINFSKYHGAGNDFILIDNRKDLYNLANSQVSHLCDRHKGIGADGLILLQESDKFDFSMRYFNADGKEASLCGNGGRCIVAFASHLGLIKNKTVFEAVDGKHEAGILSSSPDTDIVSLKMNDVKGWEMDGEDFVLDTGSPHYVKFVHDANMIDTVIEGREIRNSSTYAEKGINVNFVSKAGDGLKISTYERGVENETLACGTGAVAAALAASFKHFTSPLKLKAKGGDLLVSFNKDDDRFTDIWLEGPATFIFKGVINI